MQKRNMPYSFQNYSAQHELHVDRFLHMGGFARLPQKDLTVLSVDAVIMLITLNYEYLLCSVQEQEHIWDMMLYDDSYYYKSPKMTN